MFIQIKLLLISLCAIRLDAGILNTLLPVNDDHIKFRIYTRADTTTTTSTNISDPQEVLKAGFDRSKDSYICVHAWTESDDPSKSNSCKDFKDLVLQLHDVNYIYIDWSFYTTQMFLSYLVLNMDKFANIMSGHIHNMVETSGLDLNRTQIIGQSLGAQLAGAIGTALDGKLYQVIGLDPGAPMFYHSISQTRVSKKSGQFVQVIHTASGIFSLGYHGDMGHADYWANGGEHQPWCVLFDVLNICSHILCPYLYLNTLKDGANNVATKCDSYANYLSGACKDNDKSVVGGFYVDRNASGRYYFNGDGYRNF